MDGKKITYSQIKKSQELEVSNLLNKHKVFFAFSDKQLLEGMENIGAKDKGELTSIGSGAIALKTEAKAFLDAMEQLDNKHKKELKDAKQAKEEAILYELKNHECFYAGSIEEVVNLFDGVYSKKDILIIFKKYNN